MPKHLTAFSLLELMLALVLSALLSVGLVTLYASIKRANQTASELATIQEQGRFVVDQLDARTRLAGDASCGEGTAINAADAIGGGINRYGDVLRIGECLPYKGKRQFVLVDYFIDYTRRRDAQGNKIMSLYERPVGGRRVELAEHVVGLMVRYGVASEDHRNIAHMLPAAAVKDWSLVRALDMGITLKAGHLTKLWHTYVALRERG